MGFLFIGIPRNVQYRAILVDPQESGFLAHAGREFGHGYVGAAEDSPVLPALVDGNELAALVEELRGGGLALHVGLLITVNAAQRCFNRMVISIEG